MKKKFKKTLARIEELEHYLSESQLYGLNMVAIDETQQALEKIKRSLIEENNDV